MRQRDLKLALLFGNPMQFYYVNPPFKSHFDNKYKMTCYGFDNVTNQFYSISVEWKKFLFWNIKYEMRLQSYNGIFLGMDGVNCSVDRLTLINSRLNKLIEKKVRAKITKYCEL